MRDVILCPECGGDLWRDAYDLSSDYLCDCGHRLTLDGFHVPAEPDATPEEA